MHECTLTKEECLKQRFYDEKYFVYHADENGYLSIYDRETGEKIREKIFNE